MQAPFITAFFYFISRWFRAYILRLIMFLFGVFILYQVFQSESFLFRFDFYMGLGLLLPHIEIVELTYLILKEKILFLYTKILDFILLVTSPFAWLFNLLRNTLGLFKAKQKEWHYSQEEAKYKKKSKEYKQEQKNKQQKQEAPKQEKKKIYEWWESSNYYEVLQINETATKDEIKNAYRNLVNLYHPDKVFKNEEKRKKYTIIIQKINYAYGKLK